MDTEEVPDFRARRAMFQQMSKAASTPQPAPSHQVASTKGHGYPQVRALNQKSLSNEHSYLGKPILVPKSFALPRVKFGGPATETKSEEPRVNKLLLSMGESTSPVVDTQTCSRIDTTVGHQVIDHINPETMIDKKQFRHTLLIWENASSHTIERKKDLHLECVNQCTTSAEVDLEKVPLQYLEERKSISKDHETIFPRIRPLPPVELLGPPPRKPERPPVVDFRVFLSSLSQVDYNKDTDDRCPSPESIDSEEPELYDDVLNVKAALNTLDRSSTENYHSDYVSLIPDNELKSVNSKNLQNEALEDLYYDVDGINSELNQMESSTFTSDSFSENSSEVYDDIHNVNEDSCSVKSGKEVKLKGLGRIFKKNKDKMMQKNAKSKQNGIFKAISVPNLKAVDGDLDFDAVYNDVENGTPPSFVKKGDDKQKTRMPKFLLSKEGKEKRKSLDWIGRTVLKCKSKKKEKEEKLFRERFQYTKEIEVINTAVVDSSANIGKLGKRDLTITRGEELDIIDITDENVIICRNSEGKYGYVLVENLNFKS
ncbi:FYN-binding protein 2 isoform X2 [Pleurodeles waltl]|uniref:FYN-binding protein 2 isoform X2 n=2 Tax=Pleurodeles waltl TaxID=8319 RepID=UPI003709B3F8